MNQLSAVLKLCTHKDHQPFCEIIRPILMSLDVREVSFQPGRMRVHDVLANLRVHQQTTSNAGINTIGMPETIQRLEMISPNEEILCYCFAVDSRHLIGNCYTDVNVSELLGSVFVEKQKEKSD